MRHCSAALAPVLVCVLGALPSSAQILPNLGKFKPQHIADQVKGKNLEALVKKGPEALKQPIDLPGPAKALAQGQEIAMEGAKKIAEVASAELGKEFTNATASSVGAKTNSNASGSQVVTPAADTSAGTSAAQVPDGKGDVQTRNLSSTQDVVEAVSQHLQDVKDAVESSPEIAKVGKKLAGTLPLPKPDQVKDVVARGHQEVKDIIKKAGPDLTEALRKGTPAEGVKHLLNSSGEVADTLKKEGEAVKDALKTDPVKDGVKDAIKKTEQVKGALKEPAEQAKDALKEPAEQAQQLIKKVDQKVAGTIEKNAPAVTDVLKKAPTDGVQQLMPETVDSLKKANPVPPSKSAPSPPPGSGSTASGASWQWTALGMLVAAAALMCGWYLFGRIKGREGRSPTLLVESEMSPWMVQGGQMRGQPVAEEPLFRQF